MRLMHQLDDTQIASPNYEALQNEYLEVQAALIALDKIHNLS